MNAGVKSRQFCSVCKQWLAMDIVPTSDGDDDDGVIWFRCPQCQGFLPKLKNAAATEEPEAKPEGAAVGAGEPDTSAEDEVEYDSPSAMMAAEKQMAEAKETVAVVAEEDTADAGSVAELADGVEYPILPESEKQADESADKPAKEPVPEPEPIQEYAAMLMDVDPETSIPYRPWVEYNVGQCVHHLAWDDCGVVVAKESLPGNRSIIKVYFEAAGVVRLIEKAPR